MWEWLDEGGRRMKGEKGWVDEGGGDRGVVGGRGRGGGIYITR
jgi:hypothetical protein